MRIGIFLPALLYVCSGVVWAQAGPGLGIVIGTVLEANAEGLPEATVVLSNAALGVRRELITTDDGVFNAPALAPGAGYRLKVTRKDFDSVETAEFEVGVGRTVEFEITMKHTAESGRDEGSAAAPRIRETTHGINTDVTEQQVTWLPERDRRVDPLVATSPLAGTDHRNGGLVVAGVAGSNLFQADGVVTTNTYLAFPVGIAKAFTEDTVQEFQVLAANYPAEFGNAMGGVVDAATRSGSNRYHGAGYDYLRNHSLAADNRYSPGDSLLRHQHQAGASLGGPILRDRLFFFSNFEILDGHGLGLNRISSPALSDATGTSIPTANCKATSVQCANAINFLRSQMNVLTPLDDHSTTGFLRLDYRRSERNTISLAGDVSNGRATGGGGIQEVAANGGLLGLGYATDQVRYGRVSWSSAPTSSANNLLRVGVVQDRIFDPTSNAGLATGSAAVTVAGVTVGNPHPNSSAISERRWQLEDSITLTSASSSFTGGADVWQTRDTVDSLAGPSYLYPSLTAFAQDFTSGGKDYSLYTQTFGSSLRKLPVREYNLFGLATWRPTSNLSIMAGVRWERPRYPQPSQANTNYYQTGTITAPVINFAPRIGIAYRVNDATVVRVGYGWFYEPMPGQLLDALFLGNAVNQTSVTVTPNQTGAPVFPNGLPSSTIPAGTTDLMFGASKLRNPYVRQTTLAVERSLGHGTTVTVSLLHSRGYKLWSVGDINLTPPTVSKTYQVDNATGQPVDSYTTLMWTAHNDTRYAHVYDVENGGSLWYNAGVVELRRRMSHGLSVQASYTWSHAVSDTSGPLIAGVLPLNDTAGTSPTPRANAPTDQRHRAAINWTWQPTRRYLRGWTVSGIATLASGQRETAIALVGGQQFSTATMPYTTSLNGSGGWDRSPFTSIGSLKTGAQYNVDARVSRSFHVGERVQAIVAFDAFNAFNTQFDTAVNTVAFTAAPTPPPAGSVSGPQMGVIRPVAGVGTGSAASPARVGQVGLRLVF